MKKKIVKILAIALSLALLICIVPVLGNDAQAAPAESTNLLAAAGIDYSVENLPLNTWIKNTTGWGGTGWNGTSGAGDRTRVTDSTASDGNQSLYMNITEPSGAYYVWTPTFSVPAAVSKLRYSVDYLAANGLTIWVQFFGSGGGVVSQINKDAPATTTWDTYSMIVVVPTDAETMRVGVSKGTVSGDYYFDNFVVEKPISLTGSDSLSYDTFVYDALNYDFEDSNTRDALLSEGWAFGTQAIEARSAVQLAKNSTTNYILKADNSTTESVLAIWTPAISVSDISKVTASVDVLSNFSEQLYVVFGKADGTQVSTLALFQNTKTGEWETVTTTVDVPSDATYARIMLWKVKGARGATYFDNIQLAEAVSSTPDTSSAATQPSSSAATQPSTGAATQASTTASTQAAGTSAPQSAANTTAPVGTNPKTGDTTGSTAMVVVMILAVTILVAMVSAKFTFRKYK